MQDRNLPYPFLRGQPLKTLTSIIFQTEYSKALLLYIQSSTRSNPIVKERKIRLKNLEGRPFHFQIFDHLE